jgi:hypothetical protein
MMRDLHHDSSSMPLVARNRRGADARNLADRYDDWPPKRRAMDGPVALLAADIRRRLAVTCEGWNDSEFEALVQRIARMKVRWMELNRVD